jgi:hypothetical protein
VEVLGKEIVMSEKIKRPLFAINQYDKDGDITSEGIWLSFGETRIRVASDVKDWEEFVEWIASMTQEIREILE